MQLNGGWLVEARRVPSPHYDSRPDNETPSLQVSLAGHGLMPCSAGRSIRMRTLFLLK